MDPSTNIKYLDYLSEHLAEFIDSFEKFMDLHEENTGPQGVARGVAPAVFPKAFAAPEQIEDLASELDSLAGKLMDLSNVTSVRMGIEGVGNIDPFVNWGTIRGPKPILEASNVRSCVRQAAGRLDGLRARAEAVATPDLDPSQLHPLVWGAAQRLWNDGHSRQAVTAAAEAVTGQMKNLTGRKDVVDTSVWQEAFSDKAPQSGKPRLRWPGDPKDKSVSTMNDGLLRFAPGVNMVIRNPATHTSTEMTPQDALERLATISLLAKFADACKLVTVADE